MNTPTSNKLRVTGAVGTTGTSNSAATKRKILLPPYPISIEIHNAFPNHPSIRQSAGSTASTAEAAAAAAATTTDINMKRGRHQHQPQYQPQHQPQRQQQQQQRSLFHRPVYSTKLLHRIQLEISVSVTNEEEDKDDDAKILPEALERKPHTVVLYRDDNIRQQQQQQQQESTNCNPSLQVPASPSSFLPTWLHIHDSISDDQLQQLRTTPSMYETIQARFAVVPVVPVAVDDATDDNDKDDHDDDTPATTGGAILKNNQPEGYHFLEMNIHPSRLCRIPTAMIMGTNTGNSSSSSSSSSNNNNQAILVIDRLPINCVIVRFSDNTLRIHPSQYQLLDSYYQFHASTVGTTVTTAAAAAAATTTATTTTARSSIMNNLLAITGTTNSNGNKMIDHGTATTKTISLSPNSIHNNNKSNNNATNNNNNINSNLSMNGSFFEDDVFHALDDVTSTKPIDRNNDQNNNNASLDAMNEDVSDDTTGNLFVPTSNNGLRNYATTPVNITDEDIRTAAETTLTTTNAIADIEKLSFLSLLDSKGNFEITVDGDGYTQQFASNDVSRLESDNNNTANANGKDIETINDNRSGIVANNEIEQLQKLIEDESNAITEETNRLNHDVVCARSMVDQIRTIEEENMQIRNEIYQEQMKYYKDQFIVEAQRIRLIREVIWIYPITVSRNDHHHYIRGFEIPSDLYSGNVSEEIISAAFGFVCHVTYLISKYLGLHVRYRLHCQSSRSAIQDENGSTYPLFPGRQVEREQFEYGVHLLHRNIDCICTGRGILQRLPPSNHCIHILAKILLIYDNVNNGY